LHRHPLTRTTEDVSKHFLKMIGINNTIL
jgi:hypothetical protein